MKHLLSIIVALFFCTLCFSQNNQAQNSSLDSTAVFFLNRISQHTAPCYKIYQTENMWNLLELETFSGRIWQIQYSVNGSASRMRCNLNTMDLVPSYDETGGFAGRFELYPTKNMYNFILLDTQTGRTWQAQWSTNPRDRGIMEIY